jgi:hypothetical protein
MRFPPMKCTVGEPAEHFGVASVLHYDPVFKRLKFHGTILVRRSGMSRSSSRTLPKRSSRLLT